MAKNDVLMEAIHTVRLTQKAGSEGVPVQTEDVTKGSIFACDPETAAELEKAGAAKRAEEGQTVGSARKKPAGKAPAPTPQPASQEGEGEGSGEGSGEGDDGGVI